MCNFSTFDFHDFSIFRVVWNLQSMLCYLWAQPQINLNVFQVLQQQRHQELLLQRQPKKLQHLKNLHLGLSYSQYYSINIIQIIFLNNLVPDVDVEKAENLKSYVQLVEIAQLIMEPYLGKLV